MKIFIFLLLLGYGWASFLPNGCPADFNVHLLLPHETDCTKFYQCSNGLKFTMECSRGTAFDVELQICNWADEVGCNRPDPSTTTTGEPTTTTRESTTTTRVPTTTTGAPTTTTGAPTTTPAPPGLPNECPSDFDVVLKLPHEIDCDKYYNCSDGIKILLNCPTGKYFDMKLQDCDWSQNVDCASGGGEKSAGLLPNGCPADFHIHKLLPHETNCSKFYYCNFGNKIERECSGNTHFNPKLQVCDWPGSAGCVSEGGEWLPNGCPSDFSIHWLLPHETDCNQFYYCNFGEKLVRRCPSGLHFDPKLQVCNWPNAVNCTSVETTTRPDTTVPSVGTTKEYITTTTMETTEPTIETTTGYIPTTTRETTEPSVETTTEYIPTTTRETTEPTVETTTEYIPTTTRETTEPTVETTTEYIPTTTRETTEPSLETTTENIPTTTRETTEPSLETTTEYIPTTTRETTEPTVETTAEYIPTTTRETTGPSLETTTEYIPTTTRETTEPTVETTTEYIPTTTRETTEPTLETTTEYIPTTTRETTEPTVETTTEYIPTTMRETTEPTLETTTEYIPTTTKETTTPTVETTTEYIPTTTRETTEPTLETTTEYIPTTMRETTEPTVETTTEYIPTTVQTTTQETTTTPVETTTVTTTESIETTTPINIVCPPGMLGFVPHPDYCDAYYICIRGIPSLMWCSEGHEFDPDRNICVEISEDGCFASQGKWTPTVPDQSTTETPLTTDHYGSTTESTETTSRETELPRETTTENIPTTVRETTKPTVETTTEYIPTTTKETTEPTVETTTEYIPTTTKETTEPTVETTTEYIPTTTKETTEPTVETTTDYIPTITKETTEPTLETTTEYIPTTTKETATPTVETTTEYIPTTTRETTEPTLETTTEYIPITTRETTQPTVETTTQYIPTTPSEKTTTVQEITTEQQTTDPSVETTTAHDTTEPTVETTTNQITTERDADTTTVGTTTEDLATTTESIETTTPINIVCPPGMLGYVPHPDYCDAYYICIRGIPTLIWCNEGYEFDPNVNFCVEISENGCFASKEKSTPADPDATTTTGTTIEPIQTTTEAVLCPPGFLGHVPHPEYCDQYYLCIRGTPHLQQCSAGFEFDPELRICVEISEDGCFASQGKWTPTVPDQTTTETPLTTDHYGSTTELPRETTTAHDTTEPPVETTTNQITTERDADTTTVGSTTENWATTTESIDTTTPINIVCPPGMLGFVPHPDYCDAYYVCVNGDPTLIWCNKGYEFDPDRNVCVEISEDGCFASQGKWTPTVPDQTTTETPLTTDHYGSTTELPRETTAHDTTEPPVETTTTQITTERDADTTTVGSTTENWATTTESIDTTTPINIVCPPGMLGFVPHPDYCDAYYVCVNGDPTLIWCNKGYEFDPDRNVCVEISEDGCFASQGKWTPTVPDQTTTETPLTTDHYGSTTELPRETTAHDTTEPPVETTTTQITTERDADTTTVGSTTENWATTTESIDTTTPINIVCPPGMLGFVPHPDYCDAYYVCVNGDPTLIWCNKGYEFDPDRNVCVEISEDGCFASQGKWTPTVPDQTTTETPLTTDHYGSTTELPRETTAHDTTEPPVETTTTQITTERDADTTTVGSTTENWATTTESIDTTTPINIVCPPGMLGFVPHPDYCDAYYVCVNGDPTLIWCNKGYEFDPDRNVCVEISEDGCFASQGKWTPTVPDQTTTETPLTTDHYGSTTELPRETTAHDTTEPPVETTTTQITTERDADTTTVRSTTENWATTTESIDTTTPINIVCPPGMLGFVPHPDYCDAYYVCVNGDPTLIWCNKGYEFDPDRNVCVEISEDGCFASQGKWTPTVPDQTTTETPLTTDHYGSTTELPRETTAHDTTEPPVETTTTQITTERDADTTTVGSTTENWATTTESIDTTTPINIVCPPGMLGFVPHPDYCDAYYVCVNGDPTLIWCNKGYEFDPDRNVCVEISEDGCFASQGKWTPTVPDQTTTETPLTTDHYGSTTELPRETTAHDTTEPPVETTTTQITTERDADTTTVGSTTENWATTTESIDTTTPINIVCPPGMLGFVPHPDYCDAYYVCVNGDPTLIWCNKGYEFDPDRNVCVEISEDGCFASQGKWTPTVPDQTTTETPLTTDHYGSTTELPRETTAHDTTEPPVETTTTQITTERDADTTTVGSTTENWATTTESIDTTTPINIVCPPGMLGFVPHPDYCDAYYVCVNGDPTLIWCNKGYEFDPDRNVCVEISEDGCFASQGKWTPTVPDQTTTETPLTTDHYGSTTELPRETTAHDTTEPPVETTTTQITTERDADTTTVGSTTENWATTTESIDTTTPINIVCPPGMLGFVPHPDYCDAYYVCVNGDPTLIWCNKGYEFDPDRNVCVEISEDGCFASQGKWTPTVPDQTTTETPLTTDHYGSTTELPRETTAHDTTEPPVETTTTQITTERDADTTTVGSTTENWATTTESIDTTTPINIVCPPGMLGFVPHPDYCDAYYVCVNGDPTLIWCNKGYEFDPDRNVCVEISEDGCFASQGKWTPTVPDQTTTETPLTTDHYGSTTELPRETTAHDTTEPPVETTTTQITTERDADTTTVGSTTENWATTTESIDTTTPINIVCPPGMLGFVPHPDYCDAYYVCVNGDPTLIWCNKGYEFDPDRNVCVEISEDGCFASQGKWTPTVPDQTTTETPLTTDHYGSTTELPRETTAHDTTEPPVETTTTQITTERDADTTTVGSTTENWATTTESIDTTTPINIVCPPGMLGFVPHPDYCDAYYVCVNGDPTLIWCNKGYEFDPDRNVCVEISEDGCFASQGKWTPTVPDQTTTETPLTTDHYGSTTELPRETTAHDTTEPPVETTTTQITTERDADTTTVGSTTENWATTTESIDTTTPINIVCPPGMLGFVPHPDYCDAYYVCVNGDPTLIWCNKGYEFDPDRNVCVEISEDGCFASQGKWTPTVPDQTTTETPLTTDHYGSTTELPRETTTESIDTTTPINIVCPPGTIGFVPHPDHCDAYYVCVNGDPTLLWCNEGYEFDPDRNVCVEISEDGCFASQGKWTPTVPDQTTTETPLTTDHYGSTTELPRETTTESIDTTTPINIVCPPGTIGFVPHPDHCDAYYVCVNGDPTLLWCNEGYEFDPDRNVCVEISEDGCFASQGKWTPTVPDQSTTETPLTTDHYGSTTELPRETTTESIDTTTPINIVCPPGTIGFVPHPDHCDAYYVCVNGDPTLLWCNEGYEFDPDRNVCVEISEDGCFASQGKWTPTVPDQTTTETPLTTDHYGSTTELPRETTTESIDTTTPINIVCPPGTIGFVPHPDHCDAYYVCVNGDPTLLWCNEGYEFDPDRNVCVEISEDGCFASQGKWTPTVPDQTTTETPLTTDHYGSTTELPRETTTESIDTTTPINIVCPPGTIGFVPHPDHCDAYYVCVNGDPTLLWCNEGYEFDPDRNVCVEISEDGCFASQGKWTPTVPDQTTTETPLTTDHYGSTTELPRETTTESIDTTTPINIVCPPGTIGFVPHPDHCDAYYVCVNGDPTLLWCNEGYEFDPDRNVCVEISEDGCFASQGKWTPTVPDQTTTETPLTTDHYGSTTELPRETTTESIDTTTPINIVCPPGTIGFVPHPDHCDAYYVCVNGDPTLLWCNEGYEFDPDRNVCVEISEDGCFASQGKWTPTVPDQTTTETPLTTDHYGSTTELPRETTTESIDTTTPINIVCPPGTIGFVPHPDHCDAYYVCVNGDPTLLWCNEGYEFDPDRNVCVEISEDGCFASQGKWTPTVPDQTTTETPLTTDHYGSTTELPRETTTESIDTTTPINIVCPPGMIDFVPHPDHCDAYYVCVNGDPTLLWCNEGYEFDPDRNVCVEISEDGCFASQGKWTPTVPDQTTTEKPLTTDHYGSTTELPRETTTESIDTTTPINIVCPPGMIDFVPHPDHCDAYYVCVNGDPTLLWCNEGYEFDPDRNVCVEISEDGCFASQGKWTPTVPDQTTTETPLTTDHYGSTTELPRETTTESIDTTTPINIVCPPGMIDFVPHPDHCDAYYVCVNGDPTLLWCNEGYEFDPDRNVCVEISEDGCFASQGKWTPTVPDQTTTETTITTNHYGSTIEPTEKPTEGTTAGSVDTTLGNTGSTDDSSETTNGETGTTAGSVDTTLGNTGTTDDSIETTTSETGTTVVSEATTPPSICPPGVFGNVPHPELCDVYYMCIAGIPTLLPCTEGYEFDPAVGQCVVISENGCFASKGMWTPTEQNPTTTESSHTTTDISQTTTDDSFETTTGGTGTTAGSVDTTLGNTGTTDDSIETTTSETGTTVVSEATTPPSICPPGVFGNVPHPELCDVYYMCIAGIPTLLPCTEGYEFDSAVGQCVVISENGCFASKGMWTPTESHSTTDSSYVTTDVSQAATDDTTPDDKLSTTDLPEGDVTTAEPLETTTQELGTTTLPAVTTPVNLCPPGVFGNVPHPELCDVYYMCMAGVATLLPCSSGYEFDASLGQCVVISENGCFASKGMWTPTESNDHTDISVQSTINEDAERTTEEKDNNDSSTIDNNRPGDQETSSVLIPTTGEGQITTELIETTTINVCPPNFSGIVPDPERCDRFFHCTVGHPIALYCGAGFEFDINAQSCVPITEDGCYASKGLWTPTESQATEQGTQQPEVTTDADISTTISDIIIGDNDKATTEYADETASEDDESRSETTASPIEVTTASICPPGVFGNVPDPDRCDKFYMCTAGTAIPLYCGKGFEFDPKDQQCVIISENGCFASKGSASEDRTEGFVVTTDRKANENIQTTPKAEITSEATQTTPAICPPGVFGNVPDPENCNKFYMCTAGISIPLYCSAGFEFDPVVRDCVIISDHGCTASKS